MGQALQARLLTVDELPPFEILDEACSRSMGRIPVPPRLALVLSFALLSAACATSRAPVDEGGVRQVLETPDAHQRRGARATEPWRPQESVIKQQAPMEPTQGRLLPFGLREQPEGRWQFLFPPRPPDPALEVLGPQEVRPFLAAFAPLGSQPRPRLHLLEMPGAGNAGQGEASPGSHGCAGSSSPASALRCYPCPSP